MPHPTQNVNVQNANTELSTAGKTGSERFTEKVIREFAGTGGMIALTAFQKRLVQNYFISLDHSLKAAEEKRIKKSEQFRDPVAISWANINMDQLALNVVACARIGFDPALPNHINMVPFKNNTTQKYDIGFVEGYRGKEIKAKKYGLDIPDDVVVEIVYSTDKFKQFKKDRTHTIENYDFEITHDFSRGEIIGGFYYHVYFNEPQKNKLVVFSLDDILKRRPEHASAEFWGGEKDKWENGKKTGKEKVEGWFPEMCFKTIYRAAYNNITIDSQKIDDDFIKLSVNEAEVISNLPIPIEEKLQNTIQEYSRNETIQLTESIGIDSNTSQSLPLALAKENALPADTLLLPSQEKPLPTSAKF